MAPPVDTPSAGTDAEAILQELETRAHALNGEFLEPGEAQWLEEELAEKLDARLGILYQRLMNDVPFGELERDLTLAESLVGSYRCVDWLQGSPPTLERNEEWRRLYAAATAEVIGSRELDEERAVTYRLQAAGMYFGKSQYRPVPFDALEDKLPRGIIICNGKGLLDRLQARDCLDARTAEAAGSILERHGRERYVSHLARSFVSEIARTPLTEEEAVGHLIAIHRMEPEETRGNVCFIGKRLVEAGRPDLAAHLALVIRDYEKGKGQSDSEQLVAAILQRVTEPDHTEQARQN